MSRPSDYMEKVRAKRPLVQCMTNYVTVNDCANACICCGGTPVMTDAAEDVEEMVSAASALVLNIGTLNSRTVDSMELAGRAANRAGIPVLLDPVGAGATRYRTETAFRLMERVEIAAVKGNHGEIGVFLYDDNAYMKRLRDRVGGVRLQSINTNYPDIVVSDPTLFRILGKVVG